MRFPLWMMAIIAGAGLLLACGGSAKSPAGAPASAPSARPTAPPAQTAQTGLAPTADPAEALGTPAPPPKDVTDLTDQVKLKITELPQGYGYGPFQAFQSNEQAVSGYDNPQAVLARMKSTGRGGGILQQITTPLNPNGAGVTVEVWKDAAGAKSYFDQYPQPDKSVAFKEIQLPQPVGDQSFAFRYELNGQIGYSIAWRRGRLILGVGDQFSAAKESLDEVMALVAMLDKNAQAAKQ